MPKAKKASLAPFALGRIAAAEKEVARWLVYSRGWTTWSPTSEEVDKLAAQYAAEAKELVQLVVEIVR